MLFSKDFKPTNGVTTKIVILRGKMFTDDKRNLKNIDAVAYRKGCHELNIEVGCLLRVKYSDEQLIEMGLEYLVTMHKPTISLYGDFTKKPVGMLRQLNIVCNPSNGLDASYAGPNAKFNDDKGGFAYSASQDS